MHWMCSTDEPHVACFTSPMSSTFSVAIHSALGWRRVRLILESAILFIYLFMYFTMQWYEHVVIRTGTLTFFLINA